MKKILHHAVRRQRQDNGGSHFLAWGWRSGVSVANMATPTWHSVNQRFNSSVQNIFHCPINFNPVLFPLHVPHLQPTWWHIAEVAAFQHLINASNGSKNTQIFIPRGKAAILAICSLDAGKLAFD